MTTEIRPVRSRSEMRSFIEFPWRVYADNPYWVPPVKAMVSRLLDTSRHPFWRTASRELFLAVCNGEVVGRIAAIVDKNHNEFHKERMGAWGFFECLQNPEAAVKLFLAAENRCREQGMDFMRGPLNPSVNYEIGLLLEGFDKPPAFMMTYTPVYYLELVRSCGYKKEKDLYSYRLTRDFKPPGWATDLAERFADKDDIDVQSFSTIEEALGTIGQLRELYNLCWEDNWGSSPMSDAEADEMSRELKDILDPDLLFFLRYRKQPVGVALLVPDVNPFLKRLNGSLGLPALYKKYRYLASDIKGVRGLIFGVLKEYRQMGMPLVALNTMARIWESNRQYQYAELGWNIEDNDAINLLYDEGDLKPDKRYRIYRKELA